MEIRDRDVSADDQPEQVIGWLRSPEGESWSDVRTGGIGHHRTDSGMFADVIADGEGLPKVARWPQPYAGHDLDLFR